MKNRRLLCILLALLLTAWTGCGGGGEQDQEAAPQENAGTPDPGDADTPQSMGEAMEQLGKAFGGGEGAEPIDFRKLKDLLPEDLPGMKRTNAEGQKSGAMGIKVSQAEATYEGDDGRITITIVDMGTLKGAAMLGYAWLMADIDRESDTGYERTTKYKGYPAFEKMERYGDEENYEMQVVVGERFIVSIDGDNVSKKQAETARDRVDYGKLDGMKNEGT